MHGLFLSRNLLAQEVVVYLVLVALAAMVQEFAQLIEQENELLLLYALLDHYVVRRGWLLIDSLLSCLHKQIVKVP